MQTRYNNLRWPSFIDLEGLYWVYTDYEFTRGYKAKNLKRLGVSSLSYFLKSWLIQYTIICTSCILQYRWNCITEFQRFVRQYSWLKSEKLWQTERYHTADIIQFRFWTQISSAYLLNNFAFYYPFFRQYYF